MPRRPRGRNPGRTSRGTGYAGAIRSAEPESSTPAFAFAARAMFGGFDRDQLVSEVTAQIRKIQATGLG